MDYLDERDYRDYKGHHFVSDGRLFADPGTNPDNFCFCGDTGTDCLASGLANLEPCKGMSQKYIIIKSAAIELLY